MVLAVAMAADKKTEQLNPSLSPHTLKYLRRLTKTGVHGKTVSAVARTLIQDQIKQLIVQGALRWEFDDSEPSAGDDSEE
jgi:hypothetical protein